MTLTALRTGVPMTRSALPISWPRPRTWSFCAASARRQKAAALPPKALLWRRNPHGMRCGHKPALCPTRRSP